MGADGPPADADGPSYRDLLTDGRFPLVVVIAAVGLLGNNVASPALPALAGGLDVSSSRIGLVITAFSLAAAVAIPGVGALADIHGRRPVVVPSLVLFGAAGAAIASVDSFRAVLALRAVQGAAFAGVMPLSVTLLGDFYEGAANAAAQGLRTGSLGAINVAVPVIAGTLAGVAWRYPFALYALALPAAAAVYLWLPDPVGGRPDADGLLAELRSYDRSMRSDVTDRSRATLLAGGFVRDFVRYALLTFVPLFAVQTFGASLAQAGALLSIRGGVYAVVSPLAGAVVGALSEKRALVLALAISAVGMGLLALTSSLWWLALAVGVYSAGDALFSPVLKDTLTDGAADRRRAGTVGGLTVLKSAGKTLSPATFGVVLAAAGFTAVFGIGAAIALGYAGAVLVLLEA